MVIYIDLFIASCSRVHVSFTYSLVRSLS